MIYCLVISSVRLLTNGLTVITGTFSNRNHLNFAFGSDSVKIGWRGKQYNRYSQSNQNKVNKNVF